MSSDKAAITAIAQVIAASLGDSNTLAVAYEEVMENLAQLPNPPLVESTTFAISSGTASYTYPSTGVEVVGIFHENTQLTKVSGPELEGYDRSWRASTGAPEVFFVEEVTARSIRLFPTPNAAATGTWLTSVPNDSTVPDYMVLYVVFAMLEREFAYPSNHQDKQLSKLCGQIATIFGKLIGVA